MTKLDGRVAIVTGGGSGIGRATAMRLAAAGAHAVVADLDGETAQATVESLLAQGGAGSATTCDMTRSAEVRAMIDKVVADNGGLHVMVNNVGGSIDTALRETPDDVFQAQLQLNLGSAFYGMREALAVMVPAGRGSIVNTASGAGLMGAPGLGPYAAAKAAIINMTRTAAVENARTGVRINCIVPGAIGTDALLTWLEREPGMREAFENGLVSGRLGKPEEIANAIAFLASDEASYINGHALVVDGGASVKLPSLPNPQ